MVNDFNELIFVIEPRASVKSIMPQINPFMCFFQIEFGKIINRKIVFVFLNLA